MKSIPIPAKDISARKSSATTTSTITPNPTTPVPQFSSGSGPEAGYFPDESNASASLNKIWQSANRDSESSTASTKWGSLLSGFWSKDSSANASESTAPSASSSIGAKKATPLAAMAKELGLDESLESPSHASGSGAPVDDLPSKSLPVNLQVNLDKGVIDVDIGIPGFLSSSNDSDLSSPPFRNIRHASSVASLDSLASPARNLSPKGGSRLRGRVAGFLPTFHPDYSLQAVRVGKSDMPDLMEKIKSAMLSEPHSPESMTTGWVEVSTTLIANVHTASVKRLRMKRRVSRLDDHGDKIVNPGVERGTSPRPMDRSSTISSEFVREEAFSYESVSEPDPVLTNAIERILARYNDHHSRSASPARFSHSRHTSTGTTGSQRRSDKQTTLCDSRSHDGLFQGSSGNMVVGALEDVVKSVNHDLAEGARSQTVEARTNHQPANLVRKAPDNALREGVRSWLANVDHLPAVW